MSTPTYEASRLEGGPTVITAALPHMDSAAIGVWFATGSRQEDAAENGAAHFLEHLVFKGTRRRTAAAISQAVEGVGGYLNAFTEEEHTCFYARAGAARTAELTDVLMDMALEPALAAGDVRRERDVIKEEIAMYDDQPAEKAHELLNATQFPDHPLGRPVAGTASSLDGISRAKLAERLKRDYVNGAMLVVAAGAVTHRRMVELIRPWRRRMRPGARPACLPAPPPPGRPRVAAVRRKSEQTHLELAFRTASRHDPERFAVRILNVILGENMSSRLFQVIREEHGLAYHIHSAASFWADCGDLSISAGVDHERLGRTVRLILKETERIAAKRPGPREVTRARDYAIGQFELALENTEHHMTHLGEQWLAQDRIITPAAAKDALHAVTPAAVHAAAQSFLQPGRATLAVVGPESPSGAWLKALERQFAP